MKRLIFAALIIVLAAGGAAADQLDFDADGSDDLVSVSINPDASLSWNVRKSLSGETEVLANLGKDGDHLSPAIWRADSPSERVIVSKSDSKNLAWSLEGVLSFNFGAPGDLFIAGGDFDHSGISDAVVIKKRGGLYYWIVRSDPFASSPAGAQESAEVQFGSSSDRPFFADLNGDGDWFGLFSNDSTLLRFYNPRTAEEREVAVDAALSLDNAPIPVKGADGIDRLAFLEQLASDNLITVLSASGELLARTRFRSSPGAVVGDFDPSREGQEIGLAVSDGVALYNPFSKDRFKVSFSTSILVDHVNINSFAGSAGDKGFAQCKDLPANDGYKTGFSWKPNSDTTYYAVAVLPGSLYRKVSKVEVYSASGQFVKKLRYFGCGNPDNNGLRCNHKDFALTGKQYKNLYGSIALKVWMKDKTCGVYNIINPDKRTD